MLPLSLGCGVYDLLLAIHHTRPLLNVGENLEQGKKQGGNSIHSDPQPTWKRHIGQRKTTCSQLFPLTAHQSYLNPMIPKEIRKTLLEQVFTRGKTYNWVSPDRKPVKVRFVGFSTTGIARVEPMTTNNSSRDVVQEVPINQLQPVNDIGSGFPSDMGMIPEEQYATRPHQYAKDNFSHTLGGFNVKRSGEGLVSHLMKLASIRELEEPARSERVKQILNAALEHVENEVASQGYDVHDISGI
jgi:hypothetical protein